MIENVDQRSKDYDDIRDKYRPGHADYTYDAKIRLSRLPRGRGRSSARETAARVAAGVLAEKTLAHVLGDVSIRACLGANGGRTKLTVHGLTGTK